MSGGAASGPSTQEARPGPSTTAGVRRGPFVATGIPVVDVASKLGPPGATYDEEYRKLTRFLHDECKNVVGPVAPVVHVDLARQLYIEAKRVVANEALVPYNKCVFLFHIFDAIVLAYKNLSLVYCDSAGARSVYGYSDTALKNLLSRVEAMAKRVADGVHDTYSLTVLNNIMTTAEQRLSQVRTEQDMLDFFRTVSAGPDSLPTAIPTASGARLPRGIEVYRDPYPEVATLVERLYATNADKNYIRDFHDCMFLIAKSNAPAALSGALETRLADKDRNIVSFVSPGDRLFASSMCASAIGYLRKTLCGVTDEAARPSDGVETYRVNYGRLFSKYRGESERNFDEMMDWIKNKVRASDTFRIFWFPDIENLMAPRTGGDQEHIAAMKNSMLQHMDVFNKDRTLRSFLLLFNSSEGPLDSAFSRRLETAIRTPENPLTDRSVATDVVCAELTRYHINLTDELVSRVAVRAGSQNGETGHRVGGFAYVQAALRDMYMNQKLVLSHDARVVRVERLSVERLRAITGRYAAEGSRDTLYDLDERPVAIGTATAIAFAPSSALGTLFVGESMSIKYNANVRGDPKDLDSRAAARTLFFHDTTPL